MELVNTYEHRISVSVGGEHVVHRPGPFEADGKAADKFLAMPGIVRADSDEADAWRAAHPDEFPSAETGSNIDRRSRAAAFGADTRADLAKLNRTVIGDDAAPEGPAAGVVTAGGDRPLSPTLTTTETPADALRGGVDLSGEPPVGVVGQTAATVADAMPGSLPDGLPAPPVLSQPVPSRTGVAEAAAGGEGGDEFSELKGDDLDKAVAAHNDALPDDSDERIPASAKADEKRAALRAAAQPPAA